MSEEKVVRFLVFESIAAFSIVLSFMFALNLQVWQNIGTVVMLDLIASICFGWGMIGPIEKVREMEYQI